VTHGQYYIDTAKARVGFMYNVYLQALCGGMLYARNARTVRARG